LSPEVVHQVKVMILDVIGCALAGFSHDRGMISRKVMKSFGGNPESTIIGDGTRTSCISAACANSNMASSLDNEETFMNAWHFSSNTVFSALALAERNGVSGREFITAVAVGYEVAARLILSTGFMGKIVNGKVTRYPVVGNPMSMGSVAAACSILGLSTKQLIHALGLGGHFSPTPSTHLWSIPLEPALLKYWDNGWMALGGIMSALMAKEGYTSYTVGILDGDSGFWRMYGGESCNFEVMIDGLGDKWWIMETSFKPWPSCRYTHHPLTALSRIINKYNIKPEEVQNIVVKGSFMWHPPFQNQDPKGPISPQFSASHALAMLMFNVPPSADWQKPEMVANPLVKELRKKIEIKLDPEIMNEQIGRQISQIPRVIREVPTTVEVTERRQVFSETVKYAKGDPWDLDYRMSDEDFKNKFRLNALSQIPMSLEWRRKIEDTIESCLNLEKLDNVNDLTRLMAMP
ncbi:MmgE/PrpD family protein, partial [Chloroflexota bacterium]